jgi:hypothetical protein
MLIVSKFHDYYDTIKSFGIDKTVIYRRTEERIIFKGGPSMYSEGLFGSVPFAGARLIGFCGKLYPLLKVGNKIIYDREEALKRRKNSWHKNDLNDCFLEDINNKALLSIFAKKNTPIFIYGDYLDGKYEPCKAKELIINPKLKDWGFQSIKDPVSAFQDIYMYISGVLGTSHVDMPEFSDKLKAQAKGHDDKYSFRKPPGKRGKNRWR